MLFLSHFTLSPQFGILAMTPKAHMFVALSKILGCIYCVAMIHLCMVLKLSPPFISFLSFLQECVAIKF